MRVSLRGKLTFTSLLLLLIPFLGLRFSDMIQEDLVRTREETMLFSARAVASSLMGRSGLFEREHFLSLDAHRDLYLYPLQTPVRLNGKSGDWHDQPGSFIQAENPRHDNLFPSAPNSFSYRYRFGLWQGYLYAFFEVKDSNLVYRAKNSLRLDRSDFVEIHLEDSHNKLRRYIITADAPGWVNGFLLSADGSYAQEIERNIQGVWRETAAGYNLELRIPISFLGAKLSLAVGDVRQKSGKRYLAQVLSSSRDRGLGRAIAPSVAIEKILQKLDRPHSRILVLDRNRKVRASFGRLLAENANLPEDSFLGRVSALFYQIFRPLYHLFLKPSSSGVVIDQPTSMDSKEVYLALSGRSSVYRYHSREDGVEIMAAMVPLLREGQIVGAVVVEQTTNSILVLQNKLIEESISLGIFIFLLVGSALLWFASHLSTRIRRLRDETVSVIAKGGQVQANIKASKVQDELGDLSRTLAMVLRQLKEQNEYREKMADNLEHEMRTPLAAASASLQNLSQELSGADVHLQEYLRWAIAEITRMENLLSAIRDATSLSDALQQDVKERFDLSQALAVWVEHGWQPAFSSVDFFCDIRSKNAIIYGDPTRIHQLCDKVVENAVSFHRPGTAIVLRVSRSGDEVQLQIENEGPTLSPEQCQQVFNSMVSLRTTQDDRPHLGLGLFIVRTIVEDHNGSVEVSSLSDGRKGVCFTITFPSIE